MTRPTIDFAALRYERHRLDFIDALHGVEFRAVLADDQKTVAVHDRRHVGGAFGPDGQKVSYIDVGGVFRQAYRGAGWMMYGGEPTWTLSAASVRRIADWLIEVTL